MMVRLKLEYFIIIGPVQYHIMRGIPKFTLDVFVKIVEHTIRIKMGGVKFQRLKIHTSIFGNVVMKRSWVIFVKYSSVIAAS